MYIHVCIEKLPIVLARQARFTHQLQLWHFTHIHTLIWNCWQAEALMAAWTSWQTKSIVFGSSAPREGEATRDWHVTADKMYSHYICHTRNIQCHWVSESDVLNFRSVERKLTHNTTAVATHSVKSTHNGCRCAITQIYVMILLGTSHNSLPDCGRGHYYDEGPVTTSNNMVHCKMGQHNSSAYHYALEGAMTLGY